MLTDEHYLFIKCSEKNAFLLHANSLVPIMVYLVFGHNFITQGLEVLKLS